MIIFGAIFSEILLNKENSLSQWIGIFICVIAIAIVGFAEKTKPTFDLIGVSAIIASQVIQALQMVLEEKLL